MFITLTKDDFNALSPATRAELLTSFSAKPKADPGQFPDGFSAHDFENVVDLTPGEIEAFMEGCSEETKQGMKVFAEHGQVIHASLLNAAGIENYGHFQGRVTKRTRTITKDKDAYLLTWDDWPSAPEGIGHYAITATTLRSLRIYFQID